MTDTVAPVGVPANAPVPRHDARAPVVVALGLAGVAVLALVARARRPAPAGSSSGGGSLVVLAALAGGGVLALRKAGGVDRMRHSPLVRAGIDWFAQPQPLPLPPNGAVIARRAGDLAPLLLALAGHSRGERVRLAAGLVLGGALMLPLARQGAAPLPSPPSTQAREQSAAAIEGARRRLHFGAALLGLSVLVDSGTEHYRACFQNPAMYTPLVSASVTVLVNLQALASGGEPTVLHRAMHLGSGLVGAVGLGFHFYNIGKRPGGYDWLNFFYGAPFGAPAALILAGVIGGAAERLDSDRPVAAQRLIGLPFGPAMAMLTAAGLVGTVAEVGLLHFRGAYHNPFMWLPVTLPPAAALLMAKQALLPGGGDAWVTRGWLWATVALGVGGVGFHAYGVSRNMGGWYNWRQNILAGPPLPAPPSFSALAVAGLGVLDLIEAGR